LGAWKKVSSFFRLLGLGLKLPVYYSRYCIARRRAIGHFKRALIASGMHPSDAEDLARDYPFKFSQVMGAIRGREAPRPS
jgi:hypothetical protein